MGAQLNSQQPSPSGKPGSPPAPAGDRFQLARQGQNFPQQMAPVQSSLQGGGAPSPYMGAQWAGGSQFNQNAKAGKGQAGPAPQWPPQMRPPTDGIGQPPAEAPPPAAPVDFAAGFDPSKSIWGEAGRNAYMTNKANEFFRYNTSGEALYNQWAALDAQNPMAARAFRQAVQGMGGGQNDFTRHLVEKRFNGDMNAYNNYANWAHHNSLEGAESGFNLLTGEYKPVGQQYMPDGTSIQGFKIQGWNPAMFRRS